MEKNDHNQTVNKPISLMDHIRMTEQSAKDVDVREVLSRPWTPPNTYKIYCGIEVAEKLQTLLNN